MAFIPVADTVLVEMRMELFAQRVENTLYFRKVGGFSIPQMTGLANDLIIWWATQFNIPVSTDLTLREVVVTDLSTATGPSVTVNAPTPLPHGVSPVAGLPGNVALCVSLRTVNRGRSFRGRNFVPGLPESAVVGNTVDPTVVSAVQAAYNGIPAAIVTSPWDWVVVSRFTAGAPRAAGVATPVLTAIVVDPFVDSQRRRLTGRGM